VLTTLRDEAAAWFREEQVAPADQSIAAMALMRYAGQGSELAVAWPGSADAALAAFAAAHQALYGFTMAAVVELVTLRVEATGRLPAPVMPRLPEGPMPAAQETHPVHFAAGSTTTPVYARASLHAGNRFDGPAIITQLDATTLVPPSWSVAAEASGVLRLSRQT